MHGVSAYVSMEGQENPMQNHVEIKRKLDGR